MQILKRVRRFVVTVVEFAEAALAQSSSPFLATGLASAVA